MFCRNCGNSIPEGAITCDKCGTTVNQAQTSQAQSTNSSTAENNQFGANQTQYQAQNQYQTPSQYGSQNQNGYSQQNGSYNYYHQAPQPMTVGGYILRSLITFIPFVGGLIYFIMLFVWGGDTTKELSFRNWAKAQLWMMLIGFCIVLVVWIIIIAVAAGSGGLFNQYYY